MFGDIKFSPSLTTKLKESVNIISKAIDKYGSGLAICFNGGKDATVLLDLVTKVSKMKNQNIQFDDKLAQPKLHKPVKAYYLVSQNDFDEILTFMNFSMSYWKFSLIQLKTASIKSGLADLIENHNTRAIFLGVRNTDLQAPLTDPFQRTSEGWPDAMRVMPILKWTYSEIWEYIDKMNIPYCSLYDQGYTSIGSKSDTYPNPNLYDNETGRYQKAQLLENDSDERKGRYKK